MLDIESIRRKLPLRYPYLMVDRIVELSAQRVVALKNVSIDEPFFIGHFPEPLEAVMPGTLILEAMAQAAAFLLLGEADEERRAGYLVGVEKARFRRKVVPGDRLRLEAERLREKRGLLQADVRASVDAELAASATLSLLIQSKAVRDRVRPEHQ
jgi:3-hydroxyacyl-[acyl-carrier-protein] dehydratase